MSEFIHLVLTKFNIYHPGWDKRAPVNFSGGCLTEEWLVDRFKIFDNVCYPSIVSQTNQNFKWLVLFDDKTPSKWNKKIQSYDRIVPIFCEWKNRYDKIRKYAKEKFLITTRIDNDDAFGKNAVAEIQKQFKGQQRRYVNLDNGIVTNGKDILKLSSEPSNPFVSLISKEPFEIIWGIRHGEARYSGCITNVKTEPIWLRYIHGRNVTNKLFLCAEDADLKALDIFEVNLPIKSR